MKKTVLHDAHIALGAKMAPFGGYDMPIQYEGIIREHLATRTNAAIFDTCHMGEFKISGATALADLEKLLSCPVASIEIGQCRYGFICNHGGGVIDDQILYRLSESEFYMVVNAATEEQDFAWLQTHASRQTRTQNLSQETGKIDLQGPFSPRIMQKLMDEPIGDMKYYHFKHNRYRGKPILTSRTGYTGEIGFEIYADHDFTRKFWDDCLGLGAVPAGLGARDTLRLEMGYPLYGHELDEKTNAAESGLTRAISRDKAFIGSDAIRSEAATRRKLTALLIDGRRSARNGDTIYDANGTTIVGTVTSGSFSPSLQCALALGYVQKELSVSGTPLVIRTERNDLKATVTDLPFYKKATGRLAMQQFLSTDS